MSDQQCPIKIPSIGGITAQCINYPMGDAVLCSEHAITLGVIRWAIENDLEFQASVVARCFPIGEITIEEVETPTGVVIGPTAPGEISEKTAEELTKKPRTVRKPKAK